VKVEDDGLEMMLLQLWSKGETCRNFKGNEIFPEY